MTPQPKSEIRNFIPKFLLYGIFVVVFSFGTVWWLGRPLQMLFHQHRPEYTLVALLLMIIQGLALERLAHSICLLFHRGRRAKR
jgi:hypothetical protein